MPFRIITSGGDLLATATNLPSDKLIGAIIVNIWSSYQKVSEDLDVVMIDNEVRGCLYYAGGFGRL
jgi:hypothetical protein